MRTTLTAPWRAATVAATLVLAACATTPEEPKTTNNRTTPFAKSTAISPSLADAADRALAPGLPTPEERARIYKGTGVLIKGQQPGGAIPPTPPVQRGGGGVVLNFEAADLREVVRNILGDILNESYTIDPAVGGQVTIRTSTGIPRDALPATLETLLRMNGATMVKEDGIYKVLPSALAVRGNITPQLGNSQRALPPGFSVQIVPLRYVGVREMMRILEPFSKDAGAVRPDDLRNMLILAGTEPELKHLLDTIDMFDVDWMSGMSVGLFTLQNADVKAVGQELEKVIGDRNTSPLTGILRIIPIERLNALLVITPQPAYLDEAKKWVERLDQAGGGDGPRFYVFYLKNQRAEKIAPLLQQAFTGRAQQQAAPSAPTIAPGTPPGQIVSPPTFQQQPALPPSQAQTAQQAQTTTTTTATTTTRGVAGEGLGVVRNIQVVADKDANTLLIIATGPEYQIIEAALRKLDVPSRQVVMEVTMAQVQLTDALDFGVEWLFRGGAPSGRGVGGNITNLNSVPGNPGNPSQPAENGLNLSIGRGFTYILTNAAFPGGIQAILRLLDSYGATKVIANPHVAALDNQKATIKAGDKIPINQQSVVGGTSNVVTTAAQYIDTGVLLQVTPHINAGGLVTLDVSAEVAIPGAVQNPGDAPPISSRSVQTIVSVQSGQTMVMGGLISETKVNKSAGLPLISRIPIIGGLFGTQELTTDRTELVMFITPRLVETDGELRSAIEDLRRRMQQLDDTFDVFQRALRVPGSPAPANP